MPYKTKDDAEHTPMKRKQVTDLYKTITMRFSSTSPHTKDTVIEAAKIYIVHGTLAAVSKEMKIPYTTVRVWSQKDWWPILLEEIKYLKNIQLDGQYTSILEKSLKAVIERLEHGDEVVVGKQLRRRKVSARDAALISAIMFDKRQLLRGDPTQIAQNNFSVDDRLAKLQDTFEELAKKANEKVINPPEDFEGKTFIAQPSDFKEEVEADLKTITEALRIGDSDE